MKESFIKEDGLSNDLSIKNKKKANLEKLEENLKKNLLRRKEKNNSINKDSCRQS